MSESFLRTMEEKYHRTLDTYKLLEDVDEITYLFSGGKDATFGLEMLNKHIKERGLNIKLKAIMALYPQHVYFENGIRRKCYRDTMTYWRSQGVSLQVLSSPIDDLKNGNVDGCKTCKRARMALVHETMASHRAHGRAVVTGYTLYDALAYLDEFALLSNYTFKVNGIDDAKLRNRVLNCVHKMNIRENLPNGLTVLRPLLTFKEDDIMKYVELSNIPFVSTPCKVSHYKHKRLFFTCLDNLKDRNNCTYDGLLSFLETHNVQFPETFTDISTETYFTDC